MGDIRSLTAERAENAEKKDEKASRHPAVSYVAPFVAFLVFLGAGRYLPFGPEWEYPLRVVVVSAILVLFSWKAVSFRASRPAYSVLIGIAVFLIWIGPDLISPSWRGRWLFSNALTGSAVSSLPDGVRTGFTFLFFRIAGTALLVPVIEELFWRGWLMRYLISPRFESVRLGAYTASSFWLTAVLFASEHGPYWEVGLLGGIAYNWWMIRTKSLGDCILAHGITNACLAAYVLAAGQWQYWL